MKKLNKKREGFFKKN